MKDKVVHSVGELLRGAREGKEMTLEDVHQATKISVDVLTALEQDDLDSFQSDIYLKGFIRNYAKLLQIDAQEVLRTLERQRGGAPGASGALWDIEESVTEEKLKSPKIFKRFVAPLLLIVILVLTLLLINERKNRPQSDNALLQSEVVGPRPS
ncbi:MAG: helix-turn-helix domain-containing protein [Candidatus Krumholzibacteriia bacterium]